MRGTVSGLIWGGLLGLAGLAVLSELMPLPVPRPLPAPTPPAVAAAPSLTGAVAGSTLPAVAPTLPAAAAPPPTGAAAGSIREAEAAAGAGPAIVAVEVPPSSEFARPLPDGDPRLPAAPRAPSRAPPTVMAVPDRAADLPSTDPSSGDRPVMARAAPPTPPAPDAAAPGTVGQAPPALGVPAAGPAPLARPAPDAPPPAADPSPALPASLQSGAPPEEFGPEMPRAVPDPAPRTPAARSADDVVTDRLPRIGDAPRARTEATVAEIAAPDRRPLDRFARPFDNPQGKPALAILLLDDGSPNLDRAALARLPFAVTFALDPLMPGASDRAAIYRAAGQEVVMLASGIPEGAAPSDLEVTFAALAAAIPEAVAVLDLPEGGFQTNRPLATQVVPILRAQGRGLISWDLGLNAADQVARREGLPAAVVFRRIDAGGADRAEIRRALDRAVFRAGQTGQIAVAATASPETVAVLLEWTVEGRAAPVALAPVTALMAER